MIKFAIVGMGIRGNLFARLLTQNPYAELVAFSEINSQVSEKASRTWKVRAYSRFEDMLEKEDLDAVIITTPDFAHYEPVMRSLERGLHIMVEKPFTQSLEEAETMFKKSIEVGSKCLVAFENRWNPAVVQAKNQIERGEIGNILTFNGLLSNQVFVPTQMLSWASRSTCGWFLLSHLLDLVYFLSGKLPESVYATGSKRFLKSLGVDTYDYIHVVVKYKDGSDGIFESAWCLPNSFPNVFDFKLSIYGDKGFLHINPAHQMLDLAAGSYRYPSSLVVDYGHKLIGFPGFMLDDFIDSIRLDREPLASFKDGLLNTRLLDAVHRSLESGKEEVIMGGDS